jgi:hypothetical protein
LLLMPKGVTKLKDVVLHQKFKAVDDGSMWHASAEPRSLEEGGNYCEGIVSVNVSIY